jgi:branched-chain amino acid transport system substrate-binding protein
MRRRDFIKSACGAAAAWPGAARGQQPGAAAVNIGVLTDITGVFAKLGGEGSVVAAHMAVEDFGGEALGRKVRVLFGDHKHSVDVASEFANRWFTEENVGAVVDMPNSTIALAIQKLASDRDRISITVSGGSSDLTGKDCTSTGFHWAYDTYSHTVGMARALVGFGLDTWYFITADYAFGWSLEQNAGSAVQQAGGRVVGQSRHPLGASDFSEYLTAAQDSGAKVIAVANAGGDAINAVKQAAEIGISPRSQTLPRYCKRHDLHRRVLLGRQRPHARMVETVFRPPRRRADHGARRRVLGRSPLSSRGACIWNRSCRRDC